MLLIGRIALFTTVLVAVAVSALGSHVLILSV